MRDPKSELDKFLASAQESGDLESSSEFTIDTLKARQKLASSQLPLNGLWLAKLVQCAVSAKAKKIVIRFGRRKVEFQFEVDDWPWEPSQVFQDLLSGVLPKEEPLFHLFAGLRNSLFEDTVSASWEIATHSGVFGAHFHGSGTDVSEGPYQDWVGFRLTTTRPPRWPGFKRAAVIPVKHLVRRTADEFMAVQSYCWASPVPIHLDGRPLETRYVPCPALNDDSFMERALGATHLSSAKMRPVILAKRSLDGPSILSIPWEQDPGPVDDVSFEGHPIQLKRRAYFGQTWMEWPLADNRTSGGYLLILYGPQMASRIEFVCDGVVVDVHPLPWSSKVLKVMGKELTANQFKVGVRVLLPTSSDQLDLSHFSVRGKEQIAKDLESELRDALRQTCQAILKHASQYKPQMINPPKNILHRFMGGYLQFLMTVHPVLYYLTRHGFRKEVQSLLDSTK